MMGPILGAGLTLVTGGLDSAPSDWACPYVSERLPRALRALGDDAVSREEARAAQREASLGEALLTRAAALRVAASLEASRLVVVSCRAEPLGGNINIEARAFDVHSPTVGPPIGTIRPLKELLSAIDEMARLLAESPGSGPINGLDYPEPRVLAKIGGALVSQTQTERALRLREILSDNPHAMELRLVAAEALFAGRDFDAVIQTARMAPREEPGLPAARALRFIGGAAQLEGGRYAEALDTFENLRKEQETAGVLNNLGVARFRMRYKDASALFEQAAGLKDPKVRDIAFNRSLALIFEGRSEAALLLLDEALAQDPTDTRARLLRVWALRMLDRQEEREAEWRRLLLTAPSFSSLAQPDLARRLERIFAAERLPRSPR